MSQQGKFNISKTTHTKDDLISYNLCRNAAHN